MRIDAIKDETHIMTWKECRRNSIDRAASLKRQASIRASDQQYFCYKALAGLAPGSKQWEQFCLQRVGDEIGGVVYLLCWKGAVTRSSRCCSDPAQLSNMTCVIDM